MNSDIASRGAARLAAAITLGAIILLPGLSSEAATQPAQNPAGNYPNRPIRFIDAFPPGGGTDYMARLIGQRLAERFGQPVVVDNRPGAAGNIGAEIAAKATPDGHTLFMAVVPALTPTPSLYPKLPYNVTKDFVFVTLVASGSYVLFVHPAVPATSVSELVALAKSRPGKVSYGSSGVGGPLHLTAEMLNGRAGMKMLHVPYKGAAPIVAAVAGGEVQAGYASLAGALPMIKAGRVNALAVTSAKRAASFPGLPTIAESGFAGFDVTPWYGVLAPAGTAPGIASLLNAEISIILRLPDVKAMFATQGLEATGSTQEHFRKIVRAEIEQWARVIKDANIRIE